MSSSGAAEFAKRFLVKGMQVDLSPISMRTLLGFHHPYGLMAIREKSHVEDYYLLMRIGGAGYRTRSAGKKSKSAKWRRFRLLFRRTKLPMDLLRWPSLKPIPFRETEKVLIGEVSSP